MRRLVNSHSIIVFYTLVFLFSWAGWTPLILNSHGSFLSPTPYIKALLVLPALSPVLAAVIIRRMTCGKEDHGRLLRPLFQYRINLVWYLLAAIVPTILLLCTVFLESFIHTPTAPSLPRGTVSDVLGIFVISLLANPFEEIGWRGFALPRLQTLYNPFIASLIIGCLSGLWHLPFFYWRESPMSAYPFLPWFIGTICTSFIATWLFNNANGSLLIVSIFHVLLNTLSVLVGISSFYVYAIVSALLVIILLVFFSRQFRLSPKMKYA